ncbi:MAG: deoxyribose-phosphate aldolase [bacterium]|nr:deoxyribose-phosphate aldolase [bacterium]
MLSREELVKYLDLANHHQSATLEDIKSLCADVAEYGFNSAFVSPFYVADAKAFLSGQGKVGTVISFPLGQETLEIKLQASKKAITDGADELDISLNVGFLKGHIWEETIKEMEQMVTQIRGQKKEEIIKFILETGCLTEEEIQKASELVWRSGADFIKTSSGMGPRGASLRDVEIIKGVVGDQMKIKVAGGVDTLDETLAFIDKGAVRIGTSQAIKIIQELEKHDQEPA